MAFHAKKKLTSQSLQEIVNYTQYLKTDNDPVLRTFKTPEGYYLNITRIEQTPEEEKISLAMERFNKNYQSILQEQKE